METGDRATRPHGLMISVEDGRTINLNFEHDIEVAVDASLGVSLRDGGVYDCSPRQQVLRVIPRPQDSEPLIAKLHANSGGIMVGKGKRSRDEGVRLWVNALE